MDSPFVHLISMPLGKYLYDVNSDVVISINNDLYEYLKKVQDGINADILPKVEDDIRELKAHGLLSKNKVRRIFGMDSGEIQKFLDRKLNQITLQITQECNFRCKYCIYAEDLNTGQRSHSSKRMPFDTAQKAIDFLMYHSIDTPTVTIGFYGGEPLLEYKLIEEIVEYCKSKYFFRDINYTITTNGSLLTDNVSDFLYENHFQLLVSLDGPESVHNKNRFFQGKQGSYQTVINNLKHLLERHPDYTSSVNISAVIDTDNDFDIISDYFNKNDILKNIHTIFSKIDTSFSDAVRPSSKTYLLKERYHNFLSLLSGIGRIPAAYISPLSENIGILKKQIDSHCVCNSLPDKGLPSGPCIPGLIRLFVDTDGKFFPCERVSENSKSMNIGDLKAGFSYEYISHLFNIASITSEHCRNCWAFRHCTSCIKLADDHGQITMSKRLSYCNSIRARIDMEMRYKIFLQDINILKNVFNMNC